MYTRRIVFSQLLDFLSRTNPMDSRHQCLQPLWLLAIAVSAGVQGPWLRLSQDLRDTANSPFESSCGRYVGLRAFFIAKSFCASTVSFDTPRTATSFGRFGPSSRKAWASTVQPGVSAFG